MSWRTQDDDSIGGFCLKLKLTDSPGIAGGFYWIHQQKKRISLEISLGELLQFVRTVQKAFLRG